MYNLITSDFISFTIDNSRSSLRAPINKESEKPGFNKIAPCVGYN
jgi:hypothetical protein